jgi:predicted Rossmann fold nucleotide-binding protein DprA/Smf involved in DNA uptake
MTPGIGGRTVTRVLTRNGLLGRSPEEFLDLAPEVWIEEYRLSQKAALGLSEGIGKLLEKTTALERRLDGLGASLVTAADAHYPTLVEQMDTDPPGVLFLYGNTRLLEGRTFAVLASRGTLPADLNLIETLTEQGVLDGEVLVVGHDRPEYQRAAVVPLRWGSPRILCLDRGMFQVLGENLRDEAFRAARLWRYEFDPTTDLVVSPFRPDASFIGVNNQVRDRLVACLSRRLDFVQIAEGGNMEKLARLALRAGRPVRVSDRSLGYRSLREAGAGVIG